MAATIRLTRMGKKKRPFYRLVVLDSRKRRDGAYLANLGYYNPFVDPFEVNLHDEEIIDWLRKGATLSGTARSLLKSQGILYRFSLLKAGKSDAEIDAAMTSWQEGADTRAARDEASRQQTARQVAEAKAQVETEKAEAAKAEAEPAVDEATDPEPAIETPETPEPSAAATDGADNESGDTASGDDAASESEDKTDAEES
ncbi:MAG: 30S ribosomal protein S16 [bacterium]